jgi:uncharacterized protein
MTATRLTREEAVARLVASEPEIRALGVQRLALFGSVLRGEARADSDVDLLVQFAPGAKTFARFLALSDLLEERLGRRVELVTHEASFEPRDYLRHIQVEADYLMGQRAGVTYDESLRPTNDAAG